MSYNKSNTRLSRNKKQSIVSKISLPWKIIEKQKEEEGNCFVKHCLIESSLKTEKENTEILNENLAYLKRFISFFKYDKYFDLELLSSKEDSKQGKNTDKKKNKKKNNLTYSEIKEKNEILYQESDLRKFTLQPDCSFISTIKFYYEISHYLYVLFWSIEVLKKLKEKRTINKIIILDACLSLNRIITSKNLKCEAYLSGFVKIESIYSKIMTESFYSLLFENPKYLLHSSFQSVSSQIKLYPEQIDMIETLKYHINGRIPLLYGNSNPTGNGKTFSASVIARLFSTPQYANKTLLFACSNELVCNQVAADAMIAEKVHLWLGKSAFVMDKNNKVTKKTIIRPYKKCFPSTWKKVYKNIDDEDKKLGDLSKQWYYYCAQTKKQPDIICADLETCYELLKVQSLIEDPFVCYLDEWVTNQDDAEMMAKICLHLPPYTVLLSSVLPKFEYMTSIVNHFLNLHQTSQEVSCKRIASTNINIPIAIFHPDGSIRFPHHMIKTKDDVDILIKAIQSNPRTRRSYPASYVYEWAKDLQEKNVIPPEIYFKVIFPSIGSINQNDICDYVVVILSHLHKKMNEMSNEMAFSILKIYQDYKPKKMSALKRENIFTTECHKFDSNGKTLILFNNIEQDLHNLTSLLYENRPKLTLLQKKLENEKKDLEKQIQTQQNKKISKNNKDDFDKKYSDQLQNESKDALENLKLTIPNKYILNHNDHYIRFHPSKKNEEKPKSISFKDTIFLSNEYFDHFGEDEIYQILSTIGVYDTQTRGKFQNELSMRVYNSFLFFCCSKEIIYGTNLHSLVNIFLMKEVADQLSTSEIYQTLGRVGRMGVSNHSNIFVDDVNTLERILSFDDTSEKETYVEREFMKLLS